MGAGIALGSAVIGWLLGRSGRHGDGADGSHGADEPDGPDGPQGIQGIQGIDGDTGVEQVVARTTALVCPASE